MSMDDCFIPFHPLLHERAPPIYSRRRRASHPCLSQLDLDECAAADSGKKTRGGGSGGETSIDRRTLQILNRPVAVPPRRIMAPLLPPPKISPGSEQPHHPQTPSRLLMFKENLLPKEPKQHHPSQVAVPHTAPSGSFAKSRAGWVSKERSTPGDFNMEQHSWRFQFSFPERSQDGYISMGSESDDPVPRPTRKKRSPEERTALREKRIAQRQRASRHHAELALRKYNRANNTKFELVEMKARNLFFEFGGGCYHYNFTAKAENHHSCDGSTELFFAEINYCPQSEKDVLLCCTVGENDAGHCYGCIGYQPVVVHPASRAYGGGYTNVIDMPRSDGSSSDSDY